MSGTQQRGTGMVGRVAVRQVDEENREELLMVAIEDAAPEEADAHEDAAVLIHHREPVKLREPLAKVRGHTCAGAACSSGIATVLVAR